MALLPARSEEKLVLTQTYTFRKLAGEEQANVFQSKADIYQINAKASFVVKNSDDIKPTDIYKGYKNKDFAIYLHPILGLTGFVDRVKVHPYDTKASK